MTSDTGISNRETATEEARERKEHPAVEPPPQQEDVKGEVAEETLDAMGEGQTANKAGSRSQAQKQSESRYADRPAPSTQKVAGAFGKEPPDTSDSGNEE